MRCGNSNARDLFLQLSSVFAKGWSTSLCVRCQLRKARLGARKATSRGSGKMTKGLSGGPRGPDTAWKPWSHCALGHTA